MVCVLGDERVRGNGLVEELGDDAGQTVDRFSFELGRLH